VEGDRAGRAGSDRAALSGQGGAHGGLIGFGGPLTPVQAALFVRKQATVLGVQSADIGQFWKALALVLPWAGA
jgi:hypothetical protein